MKKIIPLLSLFALLACQSNSENTSCQEFETSIEILNERIEQTLTEIQNLETTIYNRRITVIRKSLDEIMLNFDLIEKNYSNSDSYDDQIELVINELDFLGTNIDYSRNVIDSSLIRQMDHCKKEIRDLQNLGKWTCDAISEYKITSVKERVVNLVYTLSRTDKYLFNKVELIEFPDSKALGKYPYEITEDDSLGFSLRLIAYDTTQLLKTYYWIDDSLKKPENKFVHESWDKFYVKGNKGRHKIYGEYEVFENGKRYLKNWETEYLVK